MTASHANPAVQMLRFSLLNTAATDPKATLAYRTLMDEIEISTGRIRWLAWAGTAFVIPLLIGIETKYGWQVAIPLFLIFSAPIAFLFLYCATVRMSPKRLSVRFPFGAYGIDWAEIEGFSEGAGNLKLVGDGKSITLPSFEFWHGATRKNALEFFGRSLSGSGAERLPSYRALVPTLIGTKDG